MKKICFIATTSISLKTFVIETAKYLHEAGDYDITFICELDETFSTSLPDYIKYEPVTMKRGISLSGVFAIIRIEKILKQQRFDLVQYTTPNASFYAAIAARKARVPIRLYCQWGIRYAGMNGFVKFIFKKIEKITCMLSTDIRAVSRKNLDFAVKEGLYMVDKARVLGQGGTIGVNLLDYDIKNRELYRNEIRNKHGITDEMVFGFVGRFSKDKGSNELIEAFQSIVMDKSVKLLCVGNMEIKHGIDRKLYHWAKNSSNIIFTGYIDNTELMKYYAAMDCYVHPTYREGFGMVLQEAAAMGCAIITTDIPGASEVMENESSCLLVKPKDAKSLEDIMRQVMCDTKLRIQLGNNARKRVENYFNRNNMLEIQRKDYELLLKRGLNND